VHDSWIVDLAASISLQTTGSVHSSCIPSWR